MSGFNLFVYGTLRQGHEAAALLGGCELVGPATVGGTLYDIEGRFPAVLLYGDARVSGEVWRCPADLLPGLDRYEGTGGGLFRRVATDVELDGGATVPAWIYVAGPSLARELRPDRRIATGRWSADGRRSSR